jgi:cytochrome c551/c552
MKKKVIISSLLLSLTLFVFSIPPAEEGKMIFSARCASCHNVNKVIVGPALAGVSERHTEDWIIHFVHSSQTVIKGGDKTAIALYEKFNKVPMPDHPDLSTENIRGILAYIKSATQSSPATPAFRPDHLHPGYTPLSIFTHYEFFAAYLVLILAMTVSLVALVRVKEVQRKQKDKS